LFGAEVLFGAGEFDAVGEGLAQVFLAFEGQDVEGGVEPVDGEYVAGVVEEDARCVGQNQTSLGWLGIRGGLVFHPRSGTRQLSGI
jgi:hypothetical protein